MKTTHIFFTEVRMFKKSFITALALISIATKALSMGDTIVVSYDNSPVTYEKVTNVSVASVYAEIAWKIMGETENQELFLTMYDPDAYNFLKKKIDTIAYNSKDPNDILSYVKRSKFASDYVRLVLQKMIKNWIGVRTPLSIKMAFNKNGYLSYFECRGFSNTTDGFILKESVILPIKFHRSLLKEFKI